MFEEFKTYIENNYVALIIQNLFGIIISVLLIMLAVFSQVHMEQSKKSLKSNIR